MMDKDTRDFIIEQWDKTRGSIDELRKEVDTKFTTLQSSLGNLNCRLGEGAEKFKSLGSKIETNAENNNGIHKLLFWLIGGVISGLGGVVFFLLKNGTT